MIHALLLTMLLHQGYAPLRQGLDPLDATREARVQTLGKQLRCAVCQGVSIADSPASMARAQLDKVRELVADGKNDQEILEYFVARYGEWVLMEPTKEGLNAVLWAGPLVLLGVGLLVVVLQAKKQRESTAATPTPAAPAGDAPAAPGGDAPAEAEDPFLARVRADLEK